MYKHPRGKASVCVTRNQRRQQPTSRRVLPTLKAAAAPCSAGGPSGRGSGGGSQVQERFPLDSRGGGGGGSSGGCPTLEWAYDRPASLPLDIIWAGVRTFCRVFMTMLEETRQLRVGTFNKVHLTFEAFVSFTSDPWRGSGGGRPLPTDTPTVAALAGSCFRVVPALSINTTFSVVEPRTALTCSSRSPTHLSCPG